MRSRAALVGWLMAASLRLVAAAPPERAYAGAESCGTCHQEKVASQRTSEHARALSRPADHSLAGKFVPARSFTLSGKYGFQFRWSGTELRLRASDSVKDIDFPLEWAFGAGSQAVTFTSKANSDWYLENSLTYYPAAGTYSRTPGQSKTAEDSLAASLGRLYGSDLGGDMAACLQCHSTGPVTRTATGDLQPSIPGVQCEACHGPGRTHLVAARAGDVVLARNSIQNPAHSTAGQMNAACGKCHREPASDPGTIDWKVPWNVRHQPVYLNESACFRQSAGELRCTTCHDPHGSLQQDDASYNAVCSTCHRDGMRPPSASCLRSESRNCVGCHMPRVSPQAYLSFTNHWIGVYGPGDKLKPIIRLVKK
jgi:predicted CXXCH cytochrome family protein